MATMMGCHYQDRPCHPSLCLRGLLVQDEGRPHYKKCKEGEAVSCPHRSWDHGTHLQVCRERSNLIDACPTCGGRHRDVEGVLRCELSASIDKAFQEGQEAHGAFDILLAERIPEEMRCWAWRIVRKRVMERDGERCRICGKELKGIPSWLAEVHHIKPRVEGGGDHPSNLVTLCIMCHRRVTNDALLGRSRGLDQVRTRWLPWECLEALR